MSFFRLPTEIGESPEAEQRRLKEEFGDLSDGEFILAIAELLFEGRGVTPPEVEYFRKFLREDRATRSELISNLINDRIGEQQLRSRALHQSASVLDHGDRSLPDVVRLAGTSQRT